MWLLFAAGSAFFAGVTSILAKCGIKDTDSNVATAVRTVVVLAFSWGMVFLVGSQSQIGGISGKTLIFLILSGLATGASWLCYFHALQIGDVNQVVPVDKSSTVLTILLALIFLGEGISLPKLGALLVITAGIYLMIEKKETPDLLNVTERNGRMEKSEVKITGKAGKIRKSIRNGSWFLYACGSAFFASLTAILGKIGISGVESNPHNGCSCNGVADGTGDWKGTGSKEDPEDGAGIYLSVRTGNRSDLVMLLPGIEGRTGKCGSTGR